MLAILRLHTGDKGHCTLFQILADAPPRLIRKIYVLSNLRIRIERVNAGPATFAGLAFVNMGASALTTQLRIRASAHARVLYAPCRTS